LRPTGQRPGTRRAANEEYRRAQLEQISTAALPAPVPGLHCASSKPRRSIRSLIPARSLEHVVAYGVLLLASDEASFVTGAELVINGGFLAQ